MKALTCTVLGLGSFVAAGILVSAEDVHRDALAVQQARTEHASGQGEKTFYTHPWNLDDLPDYVPQQQASGTIRIWGNDVVNRGPLMKYLEEGFRKFQPNVTLSLHLKSSAIAIPGLVTGVADIGIGRHIQFMELLGFQRTFNHDPLELTPLNGAYDTLGWNPAWVVVVNRKNPLTGITVKQLDGILGAERNGGWVGTTWHPEFSRGPEGNIRTWGQLGLGGEWTDKPIHVRIMSLQYDPTNTPCRLLIKGSDKWNETLTQYCQYVRPDGKLGIGAQDLVEDTARDPYSIGVSNLAFLTPETKALPIAVQDGGPYVAPTIENIQDRTYYLHSSNYFYINREPGQPVDPKVKEFLRYILSRQGQEAVVRDGKLLPLPISTVREQLGKLE
ncbi:MAG: Phosphate transport system substrate-binding protein [Verrucomicrobia bacterium]|nr:Phosphate transport system substrate-binding protein [Verrucomicrobiota bacterium]